MPCSYGSVFGRLQKYHFYSLPTNIRRLFIADRLFLLHKRLLCVCQPDGLCLLMLVAEQVVDGLHGIER